MIIDPFLNIHLVLQLPFSISFNDIDLPRYSKRLIALSSQDLKSSSQILFKKQNSMCFLGACFSFRFSYSEFGYWYVKTGKKMNFDMISKE